MDNSNNTLLALILGGAIGAAAGILYAPDKGEKTRKKLKKEAKKRQSQLEEQLKKTSNQLSSSAKEAKSNFESKLNETLSNASYKADDIIVSLENKLEELRKQNAKLRVDASVNSVKADVKKAIS